MNKVKAYSMMELMIVMGISTMVIAIAYTGYTMFYKQYLSFKQNTDRVAEVSLFDRLLVSDFSKSKYVIKKSDAIECVYKDKVIRYKWEDIYILRYDHNLLDTFKIEVNNLKIQFQDKTAEENMLVDKIVFENGKEDNIRRFYYSKVYGADILMNK